MNLKSNKKRLSLSLALFSLFILSIPPFQANAAYVNSNLVADWIGTSLVDNVSSWTDATTYTNLSQNGTTFSSSNGGYLSLSGASTSYLTATANLPTFSTDNMSVFFWIKPTANQGVIMELGRSGTDADSECTLTLNSSGQLTYWEYNGSVGFNFVTATTAVNLNQWNYVGFAKSTTSGTATLNFFINGSAAGGYTATNKTVSLNNFSIGKDIRDNTTFFSGSIQRATIWSKTLSVSEVAGNYTASNNFASAPSISTSNNSQTVNAGAAISTATTTNSGGTANTVTIAPTLPTGLSMDADGNISGSPANVQSITNYTITATNYAGSATSTFTLTVLINSSTTTLTNLTSAVYRRPTSLVATVNGTSGKVTFKQGGKNINGCIKIPTVTAASITATCSWRPTVKTYVYITAIFYPTSVTYASSTSPSMKILVLPRSGLR